MNKIVNILIFIVLSLFMLTACSSEKNSSSNDIEIDYIVSDKVYAIGTTVSVDDNSALDSIINSSGIDEDKLSITSGVVSLEDYYNGIGPSANNYNFLKPIGGTDKLEVVASQISAKASDTTYKHVYGFNYLDNNASYNRKVLQTANSLTQYTYFIGNLDTDHELQKVTAYVDTANNMFKSLEIRLENDSDGIERLNVITSGTSDQTRIANISSWWQNFSYSLVTNIDTTDITDYDYQILLDNYNQTLIYTIDPNKGDSTTGYTFYAFTDRYIDKSDENDRRLLNIALGYSTNSSIATSSVTEQKYSNLHLGLVSRNWSTYEDPDSTNKPRMYLVEKTLSNDFTDDYAIITLGDANVELVATSNDDISIDTDPYTGIGYFRKSGSYFMEMEVTRKDDSTIILNTITRDMINGNEIVGDNETVIVNVSNGKITQGNYILFAGQCLFSDMSSITKGDTFVIRLTKGGVVFRKDIASLYGSNSSTSAEVSGADGIYHILYVTYNGNQSAVIHQLAQGDDRYNSWNTTFSSTSGDTVTFYIPQIDNNKNVYYGEVQVKLKAGLDTSNTESDITSNHATITNNTTLAELNVFEDYDWTDGITITIGFNTLTFGSSDTMSTLLNAINSALNNEGALIYHTDYERFALLMLKGTSTSISGDLADILGIAYSSSDSEA